MESSLQKTKLLHLARLSSRSIPAGPGVLTPTPRFREHQRVAEVSRLANSAEPNERESVLTKKNNNMATPMLRLPNAWIALLPIAWLQLTVAVHQFDHVASYVEGPCHVCIQLDRIDVSVDHQVHEAPLRLVSTVSPAPPSDFVQHASVRNFDSRAPPRL